MSKDVINHINAFTLGVESVLDIGATIYNFDHSATPSQTDFQALASDWQAVGQDLQQTITDDKNTAEKP